MMQGLAPPAALSTMADGGVGDAGDVAFSTQAGTAAGTQAVGIPLAAPAASTLKLYAGEWIAFVAWCQQHRHASLPAADDTLARYLLSATAHLSRGTLGRRRSAIAAMHRQAGMPVPQLDAASRRALRTAARPSSPARADKPLGAAHLIRLAARCPRDPAGLRDRALLLLVASLSRPEQSHTAVSTAAVVPRLFLLALDAEDVGFTAAGVTLQLRTRSDDQVPRRSVILARASTSHLCPVRALEDWLRQSETRFGPVFRKVDRWGNVEHRRLGADAWHRILLRRGDRLSRLATTAKR